MDHGAKLHILLYHPAVKMLLAHGAVPHLLFFELTQYRVIYQVIASAFTDVEGRRYYSSLSPLLHTRCREYVYREDM